MELLESKSKILSEISRDIAQVFFASIFVGPLVSGETNSFLAASGLLLSIMTWYLSITFTNK